MVSAPGWHQKMDEKFLRAVAPRAAGNSPSATNRATVNSEHRLTFPKAGILRGHGSFAQVLSHRKSLQHGCTRLFSVVNLQIPPSLCRVGFAVKRPGTSVRRNHRRRMMREAYRMESHAFREFCAEHALSVDLVFLYDTTREPAAPTLDGMRDTMQKLLDGTRNQLERARGRS